MERVGLWGEREQKGDKKRERVTAVEGGAQCYVFCNCLARGQWRDVQGAQRCGDNNGGGKDRYFTTSGQLMALPPLQHKTLRPSCT